MTSRPQKQKVIGLLGGCSNVATGEYYKFINDEVNARLGGWEIAETLIAGMNFGNIEAWLREDNWLDLTYYLEQKIDCLIVGGADVILCVSNTLHKPLGSILKNRNIPNIHIVDPTGKAIQKSGLKKVALFGTLPVMQMDYLKNRYEQKFELEILLPNKKEQEDIDQIIFDELVKSNVRLSSKRRYLEIADRMANENGAEGLIMGCTEIFLLIQQDDCPDFPLFNTAQLHCHAAVDFALAEVI
ncbi:MAG: amino acid racemase [Devosiaceae bacterium]|nr:amino acid racemase [Devosiaceae bacterium]